MRSKNKKDKEIFFPAWVRAFLALFFVGMQMLGVYFDIAQDRRRSCIALLALCAVCLTPLVFFVQNRLFAWVGARSAAGQADPPKAGSAVFSVRKHFFGAYAVILSGFAIPFATYYPAIMAYDVIPQLDQIKLSGYTTHHPLIHTLLLAASLKIGELLPWARNADRAGLACYTILQMLIVAGAFAYVYVFMRKRGVHRYLCYLFVLCAAFFPTHGLLAVSVTKDTIYAALVMLFTVFAWELAVGRTQETPGRRWMGAYLALTVLLLLFRNNSVYAWLVWLAAATPAFRRKWKENVRFFRKIGMLHGAAFVLYVLVNAAMAAAVHAGNATYAREMLSVPAQQIARVVAYHEEELTERDRERIGKVWGEGNLPEYVPAIADRSKRDITNDGAVLRALTEEWISLGLRYPGEYATAFLLKNKGMWYLGDRSYLYDVYSYAQGYLQITYPSDQQEYIEALVPGYERHQHLQFLQSVYRYFAAAPAVWKYIPPLALVMQPAFYCWVLFYYCVCCIGLGRKRMLTPAVYAAALVGTLLLGPCVLVRYLYPVMLSAAVLVFLASADIPCRSYRRR